MDSDLANKPQSEPTGQSEKNNEAAKSSSENYQRQYRPVQRTHRPRIQTARPYVPKRDDDDSEGGFLPEGFGAGLQVNNNAQRRQQRPRFNSGNNYQSYGNSYQPRQQEGYQPRQQTGYKPRPQGGYQPRQQSGYSRPQGNYQPRPQGNYERPQGGYQPRQQGGYQRPQGSYQRPQGGYQRPQGSYQPRPQGGYNKPQGGYQRPQGSYQRPQGGYQPRQRTADYDPNAKYSLKKRIEYKEEHTDPNEPIRLNKYLANAGVCSRREADEYIQAGVVSVNGQVVNELGTKVTRGDKVMFHDRPVTLEKKVYVLLNKPKDYVTTSDDPQQRKTVMDLVKNACPERIYPVGRLDRNTTGVLLLTNDGDMASKLTHPKFLKKKVYHVYLDKPVTAHDMQQIAEGVELEDGTIRADAIEYASDTDKKQVGIEIHSGKNRIVRRIFEHLGYRVTKLDRTQFAGLTKKNLRRGDWRFLTEKEVDMLRMGSFA